MASHGTLVVGLTGGIGTGKSRVASLLESLGAGLACSDRIVRELQAPGSAALREIAEAFGAEYIAASGELDRAKLGGLVFGDAAARARLGQIMHPRVVQELFRALERFRSEGRAVAVLDIPLLLEGKLAGRGAGAVLPFDLVAVVYADEKTQLARIRARDGLSEAEALARIRSQMSIEEKRAQADVVIDNGGPWEATEKQVRELYARWAGS